MSKSLKDFLNPPPLTGIQKVLEEHRMSGKSAGDGIRGLCNCGEPVDWDTEHWAEVLAREGFGDLKPARALVTKWQTRSVELHNKALHMESTGSSKLSVQHALTRSTAYRYLAGRLHDALEGN